MGSTIKGKVVVPFLVSAFCGMHAIRQISVFWVAGGLPPIHRLWTSAIVAVVFALLARWMRGVSASGAVAGAIVCFLLYAGAGPGAFVVLVTVFALTWITTRFRYQRKQKLGIAEKRDGRRASQVLANLGVAAACAILYDITGGRTIFILAAMAGLSEAAADTVSSELGQASGDTARLITTWETVPAGTDGGVSLNGTLAGIAAAGAVSTVAALVGLLPWTWIGASTIAAFVGTICDSYLGAWLERRGFLNNDSVNFISTLVAAGAASLLA